MRNATSLFAVTLAAAAAIPIHRFVTPAGGVTGAAGNAQGVSQYAAASGEKFSATVLGTAIVETGGALAAGALVESDASGRAVTKSAGVSLGRLAPGESASAAGQFVEVILFPN